MPASHDDNDELHRKRPNKTRLIYTEDEMLAIRDKLNHDRAERIDPSAIEAQHVDENNLDPTIFKEIPSVEELLGHEVKKEEKGVVKLSVVAEGQDGEARKGSGCIGTGNDYAEEGAIPIAHQGSSKRRKTSCLKKESRPESENKDEVADWITFREMDEQRWNDYATWAYNEGYRTAYEQAYEMAMNLAKRLRR